VIARAAAITLVLLINHLTLEAQTSSTRPHDSTWVAPAGATAKSNPLATRADAAAGGRKLFAQRCASCHRDDGRGSEKAPDLTQPDVQMQSDGALFWKISSGNTRRGMPTFSFLPEPQRWQLVMHLRELGPIDARGRKTAANNQCTAHNSQHFAPRRGWPPEAHSRFKRQRRAGLHWRARQDLNLRPPA